MIFYQGLHFCLLLRAENWRTRHWVRKLQRICHRSGSRANRNLFRATGRLVERFTRWVTRNSHCGRFRWHLGSFSGSQLVCRLLGTDLARFPEARFWTVTYLSGNPTIRPSGIGSPHTQRLPGQAFNRWHSISIDCFPICLEELVKSQRMQLGWLPDIHGAFRAPCFPVISPSFCSRFIEAVYRCAPLAQIVRACEKNY